MSKSQTEYHGRPHPADMVALATQVLSEKAAIAQTIVGNPEELKFWSDPSNKQELLVRLYSAVRSAAARGDRSVVLFEIPLSAFDFGRTERFSIITPAAVQSSRSEYRAVKVGRKALAAVQMFAIAPPLLRVLLEHHLQTYQEDVKGGQQGYYKLIFTTRCGGGGSVDDPAGPVTHVVAFTEW